jgi:MarR family transcriptional regulator, organic hydroperoxide resistance regulator
MMKTSATAAERRGRVTRQQALLELWGAADRIRRHFEQILDPHGLTLQQYNVLRILRGARPDKLPTMEIAARMIEQAPGITRLLDRLDEKGLVNRTRCTDDRRQVLCSITRAGLELLAGLDDPVHDSDEWVLSAVNETELAALVDMLRRVPPHG